MLRARVFAERCIGRDLAVATRRAATVDEAVALVRRARPRVVLGAPVRAAIAAAADYDPAAMNGDVNVRQLLATTAALLDQGRLTDGCRACSRPRRCSADAVADFGHPPLAAIAVLVLVALAGAVEFFLAVRVGFDATLFHRLATEAGAPSFGDLDAALVRLALMPPGKTGRPAAERALGAKRLLRGRVQP